MRRLFSNKGPEKIDLKTGTFIITHESYNKVYPSAVTLITRDAHDLQN